MKKIMLFIASACMIFSMVGCKQNGIPVEQTSEESNQVKSVKKEPYYITEWSIDDLVTSVEMNGVTYSMPFTLNDLGEDYTIEKINDDLFLYYRGNHFGIIDLKDNSDINNSEIISITTHDKSFKVGDTSFSDELDDVLEKYGEPSLITSGSSISVVYYVFEGKTEEQSSKVGFTFKDGKLYSIGVTYNKYEEEQI